VTEPTINLEDIFEVEGRMQQAREIWGDEFDRAFRCLMTLDKKDPAARMIVGQIWRAPDPGKTLLDWWYANLMSTPTLH
jgi:hypothetical protein